MPALMPLRTSPIVAAVSFYRPSLWKWTQVIDLWVTSDSFGEYWSPIVTHKNYFNLGDRYPDDRKSLNVSKLFKHRAVVFCTSYYRQNQNRQAACISVLSLRVTEWQFQRNNASLWPALTNVILSSTSIFTLHRSLWMVHSVQYLINGEEQLWGFVLPIIMSLATKDRTNLFATRTS